MNSTVQWIGAGIFAVAILHTFSTKFFERLAHERPQHAGAWHLPGEVEVVFGFWSMVLVMAIAPASAEWINSCMNRGFG